MNTFLTYRPSNEVTPTTKRKNAPILVSVDSFTFFPFSYLAYDIMDNSSLYTVYGTVNIVNC